MSQRIYLLTEAAEADMRDIIRHTRKEWGDAQLRRYIAKLEQGITRVAASQGAFKDNERPLSSATRGAL